MPHSQVTADVLLHWLHFPVPRIRKRSWQRMNFFFFTNSENWEVALSFIINLSIVPFPLSTSLRKLVGTRSLVRSSAKPTGRFAVLIWPAVSVTCGIRAHFYLPTSLDFPCRHPLLPIWPSNVQAAEGSVLGPYPRSWFQCLKISWQLPDLHCSCSSFLGYKHVYTAAFSASSLDAPNWTHPFPPKLSASTWLPNNDGKRIANVSKYVLWNLIGLGSTPRYAT